MSEVSRYDFRDALFSGPLVQLDQENHLAPITIDNEEKKFKPTDFKGFFDFPDGEGRYVIRVNRFTPAFIPMDSEAHLLKMLDLHDELRQEYSISIPQYLPIIGENNWLFTVAERITPIAINPTGKGADREIVNEYSSVAEAFCRYYGNKYKKDDFYITDFNARQFIYGTKVADPEPQLYLVDVGVNYARKRPGRVGFVEQMENIYDSSPFSYRLECLWFTIQAFEERLGVALPQARQQFNALCEQVRPLPENDEKIDEMIFDL